MPYKHEWPRCKYAAAGMEPIASAKAAGPTFCGHPQQEGLRTPDQSKLEPELNHGRVVLSIIRQDPILRGGQGIKQASEGLYTAQAVSCHQLLALQSLML
jgi:hypothetical protein